MDLFFADCKSLPHHCGKKLLPMPPATNASDY
jgi:hypothetical protein